MFFSFFLGTDQIIISNVFLAHSVTLAAPPGDPPQRGKMSSECEIRRRKDLRRRRGVTR